MTPAEKLAHHLTLRPELPRPYDPNSQAAKTHQTAFQAWLDIKHRLECAARVSVALPALDRHPKVAARSDYHYREPRKRRVA